MSPTLRRSSVSFCPRTKADRAKKNFASVGLEEWVEFRVGDVLETLKVDPPREIDLILHVGAKSQACPTDCTPMHSNVPLPVDFQPLENTEFEPEWFSSARSSSVLSPKYEVFCRRSIGTFSRRERSAHI